MSLQAPTLAELEADLLSQISGKLSQTVPALPRGAINVLARVIAGAWTLQYKYSGFLLLQQFIQHATYDETTVLGKAIRPLRELAVLKGVSDPSPGQRFTATATVTVTTQTGTMTAGQQLIRLSTGVIYTTTSNVTLNAATVSVPIQAVQDPNQGGGYGAIGNLVANDTLEFISPVPNVRRTGVVIASVTTLGTDAETEPQYRKRVLDRTQKPPQGGAAADYYHWALEVPGIVDALPYADQPGQVKVYIEASEASSGNPDGFPTGSQITAVTNSINLTQSGLATRRPIGAGVSVVSISRAVFDFTIAGLQVPDNDLASLKASIEDGIDEHLRSRCPYIVGLSVPPRADAVSQAAVAGVVYDIVQSVNGFFASFVMTQGGSPVETYYLEDGEKAKLGLVSYT